MTSGSKVNYGFHLVAVKPFEPGQNIVETGSGLEIFENRGDRHSRAPKDPSPAHFTSDALDRRAL